MPPKIETRTIDGLTVRSQQLPSIRSFVLLTKLGAVLAPALSKIADLGGRVSIAEMDAEEMLPVLGDVFRNLSETDSASLIKELLSGTAVVDNNTNEELVNDGAIDRVFTGRFKTLLKTLAFAFQLNYSDFFDVGAPKDAQSGSAEAKVKSE